MHWQLISPQTDRQWRDYYHLRWRVLRAPWQQPPGSEKDELEDQAIHRMIIDEQQQVLATGRLHQIDTTTGQIRYMAVEEKRRGEGLGSQLLAELEDQARGLGLKSIQLDARNSAVSFYQHHGYEIIAESHTLFGEIPHQQMKKTLDKQT